MAISYVSGASAAAATVAMPTHAAGDLIIAFAFRSNSATLPTVPAGWLGGFTAPGQNVTSMAMGYKIAASGSETTGTWTNATGIAIVVYRKAATETWTTPTMMLNYGSSTAIDYTSASYIGSYHTIRQPNTQVWYARFAGHKTATDLTTNTPTGWTARTGLATGVRVMDTNGPCLGEQEDVGTLTQTVNTTGAWFSSSIRIEVWDGTGMVCMGSDATANASLNMPQVAAGDIILAYGSRASNTPPSLPTGYTDLSSGGADTFSTRLAYKVATSSAEAVQTMTNATFSSVSVYRTAYSRWDTIYSGTGTSINGNSATMTFTNAPVLPVPNLQTGYVRFDSANQAYGFLFPGYVVRSLWPNSPAVAVRDALNVMGDADTVGFGVTSGNFPGGTSSAWRTNTIRLVSSPYPAFENTTYVNQAVPAGVYGCYVTLIGGGGGGASGATRNGTTRPSGYGGGGGGGGAYVKRAYIPLARLGSTFSLVAGTGGAATTGQGQDGNDGNASVFTSGSITISAGGGLKGVQGMTPSGGAGGTLSGLSGIAYEHTEEGAVGGNGSTATTGTVGGASTYAGAGGGGGGANISTAYAGGIGGSSLLATGTSGVPTAAPSGFGGAGGGGGSGGSGSGSGGSGSTGGGYGGGGGGGGGKEGSFFGSGGNGGAGAVGYTLIEWVVIPEKQQQFFRAFGPN